MSKKRVPHIVILDPAAKTPELSAFNNLVHLSPLPLSYHLPCIQGMRSVEAEDPKLIKGVIVFGSLASVNDRHDWQHPMEHWLMKLIENKIPTFGICYGHQMISHMFGGTVGFLHADRKKEVGFRVVTVHPNRLSGKSSKTGHLFASHEEVVTQLPKDFEIIARSSQVEIDGIAHKKLPLWSLQTHPEATHDFLHRRGMDSTKAPLEFGYEILSNFFKFVTKKK